MTTRSTLSPEQAEMLYQIQGCAEAGDGHYHDAVTDNLILTLHARAEAAEERLAALETAAAVAYVPLDALVQVEDHSPSLSAEVRKLAAAATAQLGAALRLPGCTP